MGRWATLSNGNGSPRLGRAWRHPQVYCLAALFVGCQAKTPEWPGSNTVISNPSMAGSEVSGKTDVARMNTAGSPDNLTPTPAMAGN